MALWVGTSGWQYRDWRGAFYPTDLPVRCWLEHYVIRFATVEVNAAFYRLPARSVFQSWADRSPPGFRFAVKASRFLTHVRRLREPAEPVARLCDRLAGLGDRLGPVLLQLPPTLRCDPPLLADTLACFPSPVQVAVEPREASWWSDAVLQVLAAAGAALVWADRGGEPTGPLLRTADWGYLRCHEDVGPPWPRYRTAALARWSDRLADTWLARGQDAYAYFNNDPGCAAPTDADRLRALADPAHLAPAPPSRAAAPIMDIMSFRKGEARLLPDWAEFGAARPGTTTLAATMPPAA